MSSLPVGYRVVLIFLFIGRGSEAVKVRSDLVTSVQKIKGIVIGSCSSGNIYLFYFVFLYLTYFIFLCTY